MKLVVQIPCFNESQSIARVLADIPRSIDGIDRVETLIIDDGSNDGTMSIAIDAGVDYVVRHVGNRGLARSFQDGIRASLQVGADVIVNTDGDCQYPGRSIPALIRPIVQHQADVVIGDRRPELNCPSRSKAVLYRLGRRFISAITGQWCNDPMSGFRAYSRESAVALRVTGTFSYTIETLMRGIEDGDLITYVDVDSNPPERPSRLFGNKFAFVGRSAMIAMKCLLVRSSLAIFVGTAAFVFILGLAPLVRFSWIYFTLGGAGHVQSLIAGSLLINLSMLLLAMGIVADAVRHNRRLLLQIEHHRPVQFAFVRSQSRPVSINSRIPSVGVTG